MIIYQTFRNVNLVEFGGMHWFLSFCIGIAFPLLGYSGIGTHDSFVPELFIIVGLIALLFSFCQKKRTIVFSKRNDQVTTVDGRLLIPFLHKNERIFYEQVTKISHTTVLRNSLNRGVSKYVTIKAHLKSGGDLLIASGQNCTGTFSIKRLAKALNVEFENKVIDNFDKDKTIRQSQKEYLEELK